RLVTAALSAGGADATSRSSGCTTGWRRDGGAGRGSRRRAASVLDLAGEDRDRRRSGAARLVGVAGGAAARLASEPGVHVAARAAGARRGGIGGRVRAGQDHAGGCAGL